MLLHTFIHLCLLLRLLLNITAPSSTFFCKAFGLAWRLACLSDPRVLGSSLVRANEGFVTFLATALGSGLAVFVLLKAEIIYFFKVYINPSKITPFIFLLFVFAEAFKKIPHTGDTNSLDRCG